MTDEMNTNTNGVDVPDELQAEVKMRFELLPADIQQVIVDSNYAKSLFEIAKANHLTYPQLETMQLETFMALLGMNKPEEYRSFLQNEFKKTDAEMDIIISAINEQIFDPIKESMQKIYSDNPEVEVPEEPEIPEAVGIEPENNYFAGALNTAPEPEAVSTVIPIRKTQTSSTTAGLSSMETSVLGSAGVVLGDTQNNMGAVSQAETVVSDRSDIMKGIENPIKSPSATIIANKLSTSATLMPNKTTDYSLPKTTQPQNVVSSTNTPAQSDPYHEQI